MTPTQIAEQEKRSEELIKGLNTQNDENASGGTDPATPEQHQDGYGQPQNQDTPNGPEQAKSQDDGYREKYLTLQGKYNAEIPRLQQTIQDMSQKLHDFETRAVAEKELEQQKADPLINLDELSEYGDDFKKMGEMLLSVRQENATLKKHLESLGQSVEKTQNQTAHNNYLDKVSAFLSKQGHDLQQLNSDPKLLAWLKQGDGMSGQTRHDSLRRAQAAQDVVMTTKIFDAFLKETVTQKPPTPNLQPPQSNTGNDVNPQNTSTGRMWTRADIKQFYGDKTAGKFVGEEGRKRAAAIEADIFAAQRDGRISH